MIVELFPLVASAMAVSLAFLPQHLKKPQSETYQGYHC
jgi:hypothetical protein